MNGPWACQSLPDQLPFCIKMQAGTCRQGTKMVPGCIISPNFLSIGIVQSPSCVWKCSYKWISSPSMDLSLLPDHQASWLLHDTTPISTPVLSYCARIKCGFYLCLFHIKRIDWLHFIAPACRIWQWDLFKEQVWVQSPSTGIVSILQYSHCMRVMPQINECWCLPEGKSLSKWHTSWPLPQVIYKHLLTREPVPCLSQP